MVIAAFVVYIISVYPTTLHFAYSSLFRGINSTHLPLLISFLHTNDDTGYLFEVSSTVSRKNRRSRKKRQTGTTIPGVCVNCRYILYLRARMPRTEAHGNARVRRLHVSVAENGDGDGRSARKVNPWRMARAIFTSLGLCSRVPLPPPSPRTPHTDKRNKVCYWEREGKKENIKRKEKNAFVLGQRMERREKKNACIYVYVSA